MTKYARIIDRGECYSTTQLSVDGVLANRDEWANYNFYPQNGMVGELLSISGYNVLKVLDGIYVPMSPAGFEEISEAEYQAGLKNNQCTGMDIRQQNINSQYDQFISRQSVFGGEKGKKMMDMNPEDQEAAIYCYSTQQALSQQFIPIYPRIESMALTLRLQHIDRVSYDKVILRLAEFALADMNLENHNQHDKEQVSWFIGLWVSAYDKALEGINYHDFEETFTKVFKTYFSLI